MRKVERITVYRRKNGAVRVMRKEEYDEPITVREARMKVTNLVRRHGGVADRALVG